MSDMVECLPMVNVVNGDSRPLDVQTVRMDTQTGKPRASEGYLSKPELAGLLAQLAP